MNSNYSRPMDSLQPIHTLYGGADRFSRNTLEKMRDIALKTFQEHGKEVTSFQKTRIEQHLKTEAVQDFRIDFEDGYGIRPDAEEDSAAEQAAVELAAAAKEKKLSPRIGIRTKGFAKLTRARAKRTFDIFFKTYAQQKQPLPPHFTVVLPKISMTEEVTAFLKLVEQTEKKYRFKRNQIQVEYMAETPESLDAIVKWVQLSKGRCRSVHFGIYDYLSALEIPYRFQTYTHPLCDFARQKLKIAFANTEVTLSDGATTQLPLGNGVTQAWNKSRTHILHSLQYGIYQGWDLHPAQIPIRLITLHHFFETNLEEAATRLQSALSKQMKAGTVGTTFDDAATVRGLWLFFQRGIACHAIDSTQLEKYSLKLEWFKNAFDDFKPPAK